MDHPKNSFPLPLRASVEKSMMSLISGIFLIGYWFLHKLLNLLEVQVVHEGPETPEKHQHHHISLHIL